MAEEKNNTRDPRRRLLKTIAAGGSAAGLAALPGKWAKPVVASVILPAHAETSPGGCLGTLGNCPSGYYYSDSDSTSKYRTFSPGITNKYPGITWDGTVFSGSGGTQKYSDEGACAAPCDDVDASAYLAKTLDFEGTGAAWGVSIEYRCGGEPVLSGSLSFYGHPTVFSGKYTGEISSNVAGCKYLYSTMDRERSPQIFRNFRFGN